MKSQLLLLITLLLAFTTTHLAQKQLPAKIDLKDVVITMKQGGSSSFGPTIYPYAVTIIGDGTVTFDGLDEGTAISRLEPPVKVVRKHRILNAQLRDLVNDFYKIGFFSLKDNYSMYENGDGTGMIFHDGGLSTVTTSITINGKSKTISNYLFAPNSLTELQRKIYTIAKVDRFVKDQPYWMKEFVSDKFIDFFKNGRTRKDDSTEISKKIDYRKIPRASPKNRKDGQIDPEKNWRFINPCITTRAEIEKLLGSSIETNYGPHVSFYDYKNEKIRVIYSDKRYENKSCGEGVNDGIVMNFSVIPIKDMKFSELKIDASDFQKNEREKGKINSYYNKEKGIYIGTEIVEFNDKNQIEMVTEIMFSRKKSPE